MINNHNHNHNDNYTSYASFNNNNYANLREHNSHSNNSKNKHNKLTSSNTISHATRIEPTNLSYKDLLRKHQFTPQSSDSVCSGNQSPMKQEFDLNNNHNHNNNQNLNNNNTNSNKAMSPLDLERESFRRKPIIEEPKKSVSGYQLFAKWKRRVEPNNIDNNYPQSKALSIEWKQLTQIQKEQWNKKADIAKKQYKHQKELWLKYVQQAKRLGISVPTKSVKPMIQQIKIKNLLNLIPDINKCNKETTFLISKACEKFIQFYASKAIDIQQKTTQQMDRDRDRITMNNNAVHENQITSLHCFDALQTSHQFNFLRAVTIKPQHHIHTKKNITKKRKRNKKDNQNQNRNHNHNHNNLNNHTHILTQNNTEIPTPSKKKRRINDTNIININTNSNNHEELSSTNQIITNHHTTEHSQYPSYTYPSNAYITTSNGPYPYYAQQLQHNTMSSMPTINTMPTMTNMNAMAPFSAIYHQQPPNPFTPYSPKYTVNNNINNTQTQIVNVQQIFGSEE